MSSRPTKEEAAQLQYQIEHESHRKAPSVIPYLIILAGAAFLLLVMAYFMQQRTTRSVEGLNESVSHLQSFDQLVEDNQSLRSQVDSLKADLADAQSQNRALEQQLQGVQAQLEQVQEELAALQEPEGEAQEAQE